MSYVLADLLHAAFDAIAHAIDLAVHLDDTVVKLLAFLLLKYLAHLFNVATNLHKLLLRSGGYFAKRVVDARTFVS